MQMIPHFWLIIKNNTINAYTLYLSQWLNTSAQHLNGRCGAVLGSNSGLANLVQDY